MSTKPDARVAVKLASWPRPQWWPRRWTLRRKLVLAIALCLVPLALLLARSVDERAAARREAEVATNRELARAAAAGFQTHVRDVDHQLAAIGYALGWRFDIEQVAVTGAYLAVNKSAIPALSLLALLDLDGVVIAASQNEAVGSRLGNEPYVQATHGRTETFVSDVLPAPGGGVWWAAARGVYRPTGEQVGTLVAYMDPRGYEGILSVDRSGRAGVALVDRRGVLAYHSQHTDPTWAERQLGQLPHLRAALAGNTAVSERFVDPFDGTPRLGAAAPVQGLGWAVLADRPLDEVLGPIEAAARREAAVFALVVLLSFVGAALLAYTLTRPLRSLDAAVKAVAGGDYGQRVPEDGTDEVADLGRRFNAMAARLEALEQERQSFAAMIAHDLRSPLTAVRGTAQLMQRQIQRGVDDIEVLDRGLDTIVRETDRVAALASELSDMARAATGRLDIRPVRTDLAELTTQAVERLRASGAVQPVELEVSTAPLPVDADPERLAQVLDNLLSNAAKYSPPEAPITVSVGRNGAAQVSVQDRGAGIAPEELPHLFERFYRTRGARRGRQGGLGLGLYISRQIAVAHGGELRVASRPGEGSCFTLELSLAPTAPASHPPLAASRRSVG